MNQFLGGGERWTVQWQYWFLEVAAWSLIALAGAAAVPWVTRLERRRPFAVATVAFVAAMAMRLTLTGIEAGPVERYSLPGTVWLIALGWVIARASNWRTRAVASLLVVASVPGFFGDRTREAVVAAGLLLAIWVTTVPVPRRIVPAVRVIAASSLFVYLVHWQVYPWLEYVNPVLATLVSFAAGIAAWKLNHSARAAVKSPLWGIGSRRLARRPASLNAPGTRAPRLPERDLADGEGVRRLAGQVGVEGVGAARDEPRPRAADTVPLEQARHIHEHRLPHP
jgi:hypothetical protein